MDRKKMLSRYYNSYYSFATYRRKFLDNLLSKNKAYFRSIVLDIGGGRRRGRFIPPILEEWIIADISKVNSDIVCDVQNMPFRDDSFNTIKATELFEHIENPKKGLKECHRVLQKDGHLILSIPFMFPVHGDPFDYQRWTALKWKKEVTKLGFKIENFEVMGLFFIVMGDMLKSLNKSLPRILAYLGCLFYPIIDILVKLDNTKFVKDNPRLKGYHGGYFIILRK